MSQPEPPKDKKDKKRAPLSIITIPKDKQGQYVKKFWGIAEQVFVGTEVTTLKSTGSKETQVLFITTAAVYVFKNKFSGVEVSRNFTVYDLHKVAYIEPDTLIISYGQKEVVFRNEKALNIATILLMQHACNYYQVPNASALKVESTPANALVYQKCPVRPVKALQTRLITISHFYKTPFPQSHIAQYEEWDKFHPGTLCIDNNFYSGNAAEAIAHAIAWDTDIKTLVLKGYAEEKVGKVIEKIFAESFSISNICIENYTNPTEQSMSLVAREETQISAVIFSNCHPTVVVRFFRGLTKFNGRVKAISLTNCMLAISDWSEILIAIQKFPCFMKLQTFVVDSPKLDQFPVRLLCQTITKNRSLTNIQFSRAQDDLSDLVNTLFTDALTFLHLFMDRGKLIKPLKVQVAPNLTYVNFSNNQISPEFFKSFMLSLSARKNACPIMLELSNLVNTDLELLFSALSDVQTAPIINDLTIDGNILTPKAVPHFMKFLSTQKPILQYLSMAGSLTEVIGVVLPAIAQMMREGVLTGIDITANKEVKSGTDYLLFLNNVALLPTVRSIIINNAQIGDQGIQILINMAKNNPKLEEIECDNIGISNVDKFAKFYNDLGQIETLRYLAFPRKEQNRLNINKDNLTPTVKEALLAIKKKKNTQSSQARLQMYERIEYDDNSSMQEQGEIRRAKSNPLDDLDAVISDMVKSICEVQSTELSPQETARLIMDNITTSARTFSQEPTGSHKKVGAIFR